MALTKEEMNLLKQIVDDLEGLDLEIDLDSIKSYASEAKEAAENAESEADSIESAVQEAIEEVDRIKEKIAVLMRKLNRGGKMAVEEVSDRG